MQRAVARGTALDVAEGIVAKRKLDAATPRHRPANTAIPPHTAVGRECCRRFPSGRLTASTFHANRLANGVRRRVAVKAIAMTVATASPIRILPNNVCGLSFLRGHSRPTCRANPGKRAGRTVHSHQVRHGVSVDATQYFDKFVFFRIPVATQQWIRHVASGCLRAMLQEPYLTIVHIPFRLIGKISLLAIHFPKPLLLVNRVRVEYRSLTGSTIASCAEHHPWS